MLPLIMAPLGEEMIIKKIGGSPETRKFLGGLGFVAGGNITVINSVGGDMVVRVKESRIALDRDMARKIMV